MKKFIFLFCIGFLTSNVLEATRKGSWTKGNAPHSQKPSLHRNTNKSKFELFKEQKRDAQRKKKAQEKVKEAAATTAYKKATERKARKQAAASRKSSIL
jgi:hypothetical protein